MQPTALYRYFDAAGQLLYVGISLRPFSRSKEHRARSEWYIEATWVNIEWFGTRGDAEQAEWRAIHIEKPLHNKAYAKRAPAPIEQFVVLNAAGKPVAASIAEPVDEHRNVPAIIANNRKRGTSHRMFEFLPLTSFV